MSQLAALKIALSEGLAGHVGSFSLSQKLRFPRALNGSGDRFRSWEAPVFQQAPKDCLLFRISPHTTMSLRLRGTFLILLLLAGMPWDGYAETALSKDEQLRLTQRVRDIFEAKCIDCHGPELPRPKGKFGYLLDLKRVAENPEYIIKGEPDRSELYAMVRNDEMPGEGANVPPLTPEEKEVVKNWVEAGAPSDLPSTTEVSSIPPSEGPKLVMPFWKRAVRWIGRLHPVSTHFPVALMLVAVVAEALAWWTRRDTWLNTVRFLVVLAALGAVVATALGWVNAAFTSYTGQLAPVLRWHRWLGTATSLWILLCAALVMMDECGEGSRRRQTFRGALLLGAALVSISGFLGSVLIYGLDHYAWD